MGAPTVLTPEVQARVAKMVNAGAPIPTACAACGLSWNTAKVWLARGREGGEGNELYVGFLAAMNEAKAAWEAGTVLRITKASDKDWKAGAWLLERRVPGRYQQRTKVDAEVKHGGEVKVTLYVPDNKRGRE